MEIKLCSQSDLFKKFCKIGIEDNKFDLFCDSFSEFIVIIDSLDISEETKNYLYDIFLKDMNIYFKHKEEETLELEKNIIKYEPFNDNIKGAIKILKSYQNKLVYEISEKDKKAVKIVLQEINNLNWKNEIYVRLIKSYKELLEEK